MLSACCDLRGENMCPQEGCYAISIVGRSDTVGCCKRSGDSIGNRNADPAKEQRLNIIIVVAKIDGFMG